MRNIECVFGLVAAFVCYAGGSLSPPPFFRRPPYLLQRKRHYPPSTQKPATASLTPSVNNDYMVCKPISGVFGMSTNGDGDVLSTVLRGPEGTPGPQGRDGRRGAIGKADYNEAERIIETSLRDMKDKIYALELEVEKFPVAYGGASTAPKPTKSPDQVANEKECKERFDSSVAIDRMCYNIIGGEGWLWSQPVAQSQCEKLGGNLADLESKEMYDVIYNLADERFDISFSAWTGMRYKDKKLMKRDNDTEILYAKWASGYPRGRTGSSSYFASFTRVYIYLDTSGHVRRIQNARPTNNYANAICSYDLDKANATTTVSTTATTDDDTTSLY